MAVRWGTMAVAMSGAVLGMPASIYATMTTIAATIVSQLAMTDSTNFAVKTLAEVWC